MEESPRPPFAWGTPSKTQSNPNDQLSDSTIRKSEFPALGSSSSSSKSASRKRSSYFNNQRNQIDYYPPRHAILAQRQLSYQGTSTHLDSTNNGNQLTPIERNRVGESEEDENPSLGVQQNGMSSVTVYDRSGKRISNGPDIYGRHGKRYVKGKQRQRFINTPESEEEMQINNPAALPYHTPFVLQQPVPPPLHLTKERIDLLIAEAQRAKRAKAAVLRQEGPMEEDRDDPLIEQITRAFSSVEGFKKAFSIDTTNESL